MGYNQWPSGPNVPGPGYGYGYGYGAQQNSILPAQTIPKANGKSSIDQIRMYPGSSALVMDTTAPIVWMCVSDDLGNVSSTPFDIKPHEQTQTQQVADQSNMATMVSILSTMTDKLNQIVEVLNAKSNDGGADGAKAGEPRANGGAV